jgi:hypothetical protein
MYLQSAAAGPQVSTGHSMVQQWQPRACANESPHTPLLVALGALTYAGGGDMRGGCKVGQRDIWCRISTGRLHDQRARVQTQVSALQGSARRVKAGAKAGAAAAAAAVPAHVRLSPTPRGAKVSFVMAAMHTECSPNCSTRCIRLLFLTSECATRTTTCCIAAQQARHCEAWRARRLGEL